YTAAVALHSFGRTAEAMRRLEALRERWPGNPDVLLALATMQRDAGQIDAARAIVESLLRAHPDDRNARQLRDELAGPPPPTR
ncbi:MAG TPA: tetratricopeptide repeat protein, partial [Myxococcota bacterium]|nr:tetratricopeptide repeat protein [Myxococcota bacterium]